MKEVFKAEQIAENVYWVGAVDWNVRNFHGYQTGRGSTYNAFLVIDEKVTLIDTVKAPFFGEMLARIRSVIDPEKIDYIISNHAEPDHSGAIVSAIEAIHPEKVFVSPLGEKALRAYYGADLDLTVVKTGESVKLGKGTFSFIETKMLHWPDSMVTYLDTAKLLFSQDAFGMHLAGSKLWADEYPEFVLDYEGRKYFANILNVQSAKVLDLLNALPGLNLDIAIIAPDHGPLWRKNLGWILDLYRDCAEQKPTSRALVVYSTMWHSTEKLANAIADGIRSTDPFDRRNGRGGGSGGERPQRDHDRSGAFRCARFRCADDEQPDVPGDGGCADLHQGVAAEEQARSRVRFVRLERRGGKTDCR